MTRGWKFALFALAVACFAGYAAPTSLPWAFILFGFAVTLLQRFYRSIGI